MALTKNKISEIIQDLKSANQTNSTMKYDKRVIWEVADMALSYLMSKLFWTIRKEGSYSFNNEFITTYKAKVKHDTVRELRYINLPARLISLPDDRGLIQVSPMMNDGEQWVRVNVASNAVYSGLEAGKLSGKTGYRIEGQKIYFQNLKPQYNGSDVLVKMIASTENLGEDAPLPIPSDFEAEFLQMVIQFFNESKMTPQDKTVDNIAN